MTDPMSHEEAQTSLDAAALDILSDEEQRAVLVHAATCAACRPELAILRATVSSLAHAAPPARLEPERSAALLSRLIARAAADAEARAQTRGSRGPKLAPSGTTGGAPRRLWPGMAAAALAAALLFAVSLLGRERRTAASLLTQLDASTARVDSLAATLAAQRGILDAITGPDVGVVTLTSTGQRPPVALMFWDREANHWTMFAHHLPTPPEGRTYQLWLVTDEAKISAGTFASDSTGSAVVRANYALAPDALQAVAVTDEPAGGVPQPTGRVVLAGNAER